MHSNLLLTGRVPHVEQDDAAGGGEGHGEHVHSVGGWDGGVGGVRVGARGGGGGRVRR